MQQQHLQVHGCDLWVRVHQPTHHIQECQDPKWVLLMHGFPDTGSMWEKQIEALAAAGYSVVAPDMPGFGRSNFIGPAQVRQYTLRNIVAVMCALLDELGIASATIVGHDWGAAVAWAMVFQVSDKVDRLVVLSVGHPGAGAAEDPRQRAHWWYQLFFCLPDAEAALVANDWEAFRLIMGPSCSAGQLQDYVAQLSQPGALTASLNWYRANTHARHFGATRPHPATVQVSVPVLAVWSSLDTALLEPQMTASSRYVAEGCWHYKRLEGVGHWIPREAPEQLNQLLLQFLATSHVPVTSRRNGARPQQAAVQPAKRPQPRL